MEGNKMKKIVAMLLALLLLGCIAVAEAPAVEAAVEATDAE